MSDATGLSRGPSRWLLPRTEIILQMMDATGLPGGVSPLAVKMFLQPYAPDELHFAYCYRVYLRWRTHRARPYSQLGRLDKTSLSALVSEYDIHVLECAADATVLLTEVSLKPTETVSA